METSFLGRFQISMRSMLLSRAALKSPEARRGKDDGVARRRVTMSVEGGGYISTVHVANVSGFVSSSSGRDNPHILGTERFWLDRENRVLWTREPPTPASGKKVNDV